MPDGPAPADIRRSYDLLAERYSAQLGDELVYKPLDRALLGALIEQHRAGTSFVDLGCGPGHVTAWLTAHGVAAVGIDMSPGMVAVAQREHPEVEFRQGDLLSLPASDGEFGSAVSFYSIIHLDELWGQGVDLDFRFLETAAVVDMLDAAGFEIEAQLERSNYPEEVETRRA